MKDASRGYEHSISHEFDSTVKGLSIYPDNRSLDLFEKSGLEKNFRVGFASPSGPGRSFIIPSPHNL